MGNNITVTGGGNKISVTEGGSKIIITTTENKITVSAKGTQGPAGSGSLWGGIGGTLSDQIDLKNQQDAQDTAIGLNTAKVSNVTTNLTTSQTTTTVDVESSDGTNATLPQAIAGGNAGVLSGADKTKLDATSGTNTGDQDLSGLALKSNVLELDNTDVFTPDADYEPATKKYVDDNSGGGAVDSVNGETGVVVLDADDISDAATTNKYTTAAEITKLSGIEALAEVNNISDTNATDLTDAGDSALHFHSTDRARANHTGTQLASTISDFDTEVANNSAVVLNTAKLTNVTTNLTTSQTSTTVDVISSDGTNATLPQAISGGNAGVMSGADKASLSSIGVISGCITGMEVTVNGGDSALFDVAAGTGVIIDYSTPSAPVITNITFAGVTGVTITGIAAELFTSLYVNSSGTVIQVAGALLTPAQIRQNIVIDALIHNDNATVTDIAVNSVQAYQYGNAIFDYIRKLGPINDGNGYSSGGANLSVSKAAGTTTLPWINRDVDAQNPTESINAVMSPLGAANWSAFYQDGAGDFTIEISKTAVDPDLWDDGTGTLDTVSNNKYTIKRFYFFGQNNQTVSTYGQAEYSSLVAAEASIFSEAPSVSPLLSTGTFVTALIVKKGVTDLDSAISGGTAKFVNITSQTSAAAGGSGAQDLQNTYDLSTQPQIITSTSGGALQVRRGSTADTDNIFEGQNGAGSVTFSVDGNGNIISNNLALKANWGLYATNAQTNGNTVTIAAGEVLEYVLDAVVVYRFYTTAVDSQGYPNEDSFYSAFDGVNLTGLIATRGI